MLKTGNPVHDFNRWDEEQWKWILSRPCCDICGDHILEESYYDLYDTKYCTKCIEKYRKWFKE